MTILQHTSTPLRAVFMGTPAFAATILEKVLQDPTIEVVAVYCQPDRPAGRGKNLKKPEVKILAEQHGLAVLQPLNFKDEQDRLALASFAPDVLLVAAYGLILPQAVLDIPKLMPINVHASLLPKYRGAAPIQRSIMHGDTETGITIMRMEAGLDSGPILLQEAVPITVADTSSTMHDKLATTGGTLLCQALQRLRNNTLVAVPQDGSQSTHAAKLTKEESNLDLRAPQEVLHARIRGLTPWPGAKLTFLRPGQAPLAVQVAPGLFPLPDLLVSEVEHFLAEHKEKKHAILPGTILGIFQKALCIACGNGTFYAFQSLRPAGKNAMDGKAFFNGYLAGFPGSRCLVTEDN